MFYAGECVQTHHGFGVVVSSGVNPRVRLIGGGELRIDEHTLQLVPDEVHDVALLNLMEIERWLTWRVYGVIEPDAVSLPRPGCDMATAMQRSAKHPPLPPAESEPLDSAVLCFP
jgi:hypothetical protein